MQDKRLTHRLTEYWNKLRGDAPLPEWAQFDSGEFNDIWQHCCGWQVNESDGNTVLYTYAHLGEAVKKISRNTASENKKFTMAKPSEEVADGKPKKPRAVPPEEMFSISFQQFPAARILQKIDKLVSRPAIVIEEGRGTDKDGQSVRFRSCLLPFGKEDGAVTHIVLGLSWKNY